MAVTFLGVRHHSPACAREVQRTIERLRPAHVLVEGPVDFTDRVDELLLGHTLPVAVYTYYRDGQRVHASWTPLCEYSPEWVAITTGRAVGAQVRFIDLPAWHPAFAGRDNRYADAETRYAEIVERLCREFAVDNVDVLWDHLVEVAPDDDLAPRLTAYFDLLRGDSAAGEQDRAREEYMASWVRAAAADAGDRPVVVVTGGFHTPALRVLAGSGDREWPEAPAPPPGSEGASYLVPYSYRRLDAFSGYQSGMPSPEYYHWLWTGGVASAATALTEAVTRGLRARHQPVSTADLIAARTLAEGLARMRGHELPARTDVLDGLLGALVSEELPQPPPWSRRGPLPLGTHPAVVEVVAALSGDREGALHPDTPAPPLVGATDVELSRLRLDHGGEVRLDLADPVDLERSRALHRLRVLEIPGFTVRSSDTALAFVERWLLRPDDNRGPALIEAAVHGATLADASAAVLGARVAPADAPGLAALLVDARLCGIVTLYTGVVDALADSVAQVSALADLGDVLTEVLGLWRHDRIFGTAGSPALGQVLDAAVTRVLWLVEGLHGGPQPAERGRLSTLAATRDTVRHAAAALGVGAEAAVDVLRRVAADLAAPPDVRGAAFGFGWSLGLPVDVVTAARGMTAPDTMGDWLAGLFALARAEVLDDPEVIAVLDDAVTALSDHDFLLALPALRQAYGYFPPAERETIARLLLDRRGSAASARSVVHTAVDPSVVSAAMALERAVDAVLSREGLA
ncbi:DUF5682 family protein [Actinokineospora globicatena]|uniref:DUF5682 family protein n=1 Tax=Actinokineospora globicatena TaxID=103729 RepID=UPI0031D31A3B